MRVPKIKKIELAKIWLIANLRDGPKTVKSIFEVGKQYGLSIRILRRAKKELGIKSTHVYNTQNHTSLWIWELPPKK